MDVGKLYKKLFGQRDDSKEPQKKVNESDSGTGKPSLEILKPLFDQDEDLVFTPKIEPF